MKAVGARAWSLVGAAAMLGCVSAALAQEQVVIDLAGLRIRNSTNQSRSSAPDTISSAYRYHTSIVAMVHGVGGFLELRYSSPTPLSQVLTDFGANPAVLVNDVDNCSGVHPLNPSINRLEGSTVLPGWSLDYGFTLTTEIDAGGVARFSLTNVVLSPSLLTGYLLFDSGSLTVTGIAVCYPNCDGSSVSPALTANDFQCFLNAFAAGQSYANCDCTTSAPLLNTNDFQCFLNRFAAGCP